jgi:DNA modification methylase
MSNWLPVILAMKPTDGTFAENAAKWGVAGLNIDGTRISTGENLNGGAYAKIGSERHDGTENWRFKRDGGAGDFKQPSGRWPANVVFTHHPSCVLEGMKRVECDGVKPSRVGLGREGNHTRGIYGAKASKVTVSHVGEDGTETVEDWSCHPDCPVKALDDQSGERKTTWISPDHQNNRDGDFLGSMKHPGSQGFNDTGGASRFFFCSKDMTGFIEWLRVLVTQPGDNVIFDPFTGSIVRNGKMEIGPFEVDKVHQADCLEAMKKMPDACVTAIVCDPPYGLEFMGHKWDHGVPGMEFWKEALRVCKPGTPLLAFGGTRTFHRLACAIEDAGWELRDTILWLHGCLSEDTEILIDGRWEHYHKSIAGHRALCYIPERDKYEWQTVQEVFEYDYADTAYRIQSDSTDQLVSRNHRCLVERGGGYEFQLAETLECEARIPVLEGVQDLLAALPLPHERTGGAEPLLFTGVHSEESGKDEAVGGAQRANDKVLSLRQECVEAGCMVAEDKDAVLFQTLQRDFAWQGTGETRTQGTFCVDERIGGIVSPQDERSKQPGMEGRRDVLPQERELQADKVRPVPRGVHGDGASGRLRDGAPLVCGSGDGAMPASLRSGTSQESRPAGQPAGESGTVRQQSGAQVVRDTWHTRTIVARVEPVHYTGKVWCVRVPSGAFVARRNGKVFVTGNSGFPKSLDISKAIDKAAGTEREVVGTKEGMPGYSLAPSKGRGSYNAAEDGSWQDSKRECEITAPATDAAKKWEGYGTALKPAWEPIICAMKPCEGSFAENAQKHGVAGLNIDGARIKVDGERPKREVHPLRDDVDYDPNSLCGRVDGSLASSKAVGTTSEGRWPANVAHDGSDEVVELFPDVHEAGCVRDGSENPKTEKYQSEVCYGEFTKDTGTMFRIGDSGSAARFFYTAKASKEERGPGNSHPTVKPLDLMKWLVTLVKMPENNLVLDPFAGSGTTGLACKLLNVPFLGFELDEKWVKIGNRRIRSVTHGDVSVKEYKAGQKSLFEDLE